MKYTFEWDPNKARKNLQKHKISFEYAAEVFLDPFAISLFDQEHSENEDRWITIGKNKNESVLVIIHTFLYQNEKQCHIRMISARKATQKEMKQYQLGAQR